MEYISRRLFVGGVIASSASIFGRYAHAATPVSKVRFMTEDYPPFNYAVDGKLRGISADIMVELFKRTGSDQRRSDIELLPWARGYNLTLRKKNCALFSTTRTEERERLFKWVGPFAKTEVGLTARKDRKLSVTSPSDLSGLRIGVVKDDIGQQLLKAAKVPDVRLDVVLSNDLNYKKFIAGRIDAIAYETAATKFGLKSFGEKLNDYEMVYQLKQGDLYLALNPQTPDAAVAELQSAFDLMVKDGTYKWILSRYLGQA